MHFYIAYVWPEKEARKAFSYLSYAVGIRRGDMQTLLHFPAAHERGTIPARAGGGL